MDQWKEYIKNIKFSNLNLHLTQEDESYLSQSLYNALVSSNEEEILENLNWQHRKWIHNYAAIMNVSTESFGNNTERKSIKITKPSSCTLSDIMIKSPDYTGYEQRQKQLKKKNKQIVKLKKLEKMNNWKTECCNCMMTLGAEEAMYHWSGLGPLCENCIENDPELDGLKWENKSSFWL